jgi:hypothetical protein
MTVLNISQDTTLKGADAAIFQGLLNRLTNNLGYAINHNGRVVSVIPGSPLPLLPEEVANPFDAALLRFVQTVSKEKPVHLTYSREDAELLLKVQHVVTRAGGWQLTGVMFGQGAEWFRTWKQELFAARAVIVCFTEGDAKKLNNQGIGYVEKLTDRFQSQKEDAALYMEAMAILEKQATDPSFCIYVVDGVGATPEQLHHNLGNPSYGPVDLWKKFLHNLPQHAQHLQYPPGIRFEIESASPHPQQQPQSYSLWQDEIRELKRQQMHQHLEMQQTQTQMQQTQMQLQEQIQEQIEQMKLMQQQMHRQTKQMQQMEHMQQLQFEMMQTHYTSQVNSAIPSHKSPPELKVLETGLRRNTAHVCKVRI